MSKILSENSYCLYCKKELQNEEEIKIQAHNNCKEEIQINGIENPTFEKEIKNKELAQRITDDIRNYDREWAERYYQRMRERLEDYYANFEKYQAKEFFYVRLQDKLTLIWMIIGLTELFLVMIAFTLFLTFNIIIINSILVFSYFACVIFVESKKFHYRIKIDTIFDF